MGILAVDIARHSVKVKNAQLQQIVDQLNKNQMTSTVFSEKLNTLKSKMGDLVLNRPFDLFYFFSHIVHGSDVFFVCRCAY